MGWMVAYIIAGFVNIVAAIIVEPLISSILFGIAAIGWWICAYLSWEKYQ